MLKFFKNLGTSSKKVEKAKDEVVEAVRVCLASTRFAFTNCSEDAVASSTHLSVSRSAKRDSFEALAGPFDKAFYFEITVTAFQPTDSLAIGISDPTHVCIVLSDGSVPPLTQIDVQDTIGCGITQGGKVFFTANGRYLGSPSTGLLESAPWRAVLYLSRGIAVTTNFGGTPFAFAPSMTRQPTTADALLPDVSFVCGPMISVGMLSAGSGFKLTNTAPSPTECIPWRESKAQIIPPLTLRHPKPYYEIILTALGPGTVVGIGVAEIFTTSGSYRGLPGWTRGEVGLHSDDLHVYTGKGTGEPIMGTCGWRGPCKVGDVLGCGIDAMFRVFFTRNGQYLGAPHPIPVEMDRLCFTLGLDASTAVEVNVGGKPFVYTDKVTPVVATERADDAVVPVWVTTSDVLRLCMEFLQPKELLLVSLVCHHFYNSATSDIVWQPPFIKRHPTGSDPGGDYLQWYFHYVTVEKKRMLEKLRELEEKAEALISNAKRFKVCAKKPVIYLYSERPTTASVKVTLKNKSSVMSFTYPPIETWGTVELTGDMDVSRLAVAGFPVCGYLFWEAHLGHNVEATLRAAESSDQSYCTSLDTLATYLTAVLPFYGLRGVEITDFITYWVPQLAERYGGSRAMISVRFLREEVVADAVAELDVVGRHGEKVNMLRVYAIFEAVDSIIKSDDVSSWHRDHKSHPSRRAEVVPGEVDILAVEWGGMIL